MTEITGDVPKTRTLSREELLDQVGSIPTLPSVVAAIVSMDAQSPEAMSQLREFVKLDPSLASRVLSIANSAAYAPVTPIVEVEAAVLRLGARVVTEVVRSFAVMRIFVPSTDEHRLLWAHGVQVGTMARMVAEHAQIAVSPEFCYTVGLMHDIGRMIMFAHDPAKLDAVAETGWGSPEELLQAEQRVFGIDHAELGAAICDHWGIPDEIVEAIRDHHRPAGPGAPPNEAAVNAILRMTDQWSCIIALGERAGETSTPLSDRLAAAILPECESMLVGCDLASIANEAIEATAIQAYILGLSSRPPGPGE